MYDVIDQEGNVLEHVEQTITAIIMYNSLDPSERTIAKIQWGSDRSLIDYLDGLPNNQDWFIFVNGKIYENPEDWYDVKLNPNDCVVVTLRQGFIIPAFIVAAFAAIGVTSAIAVSVITTVALTAVLAGGFLLSGILATPSSPSSSGAGSNYGITGAKNTAAYGTVVPVVYGTFRMAGNKVNFYVDNGNNIKSQVLYVQYVLSEGEITNVSSVQIDQNPIENYTNAIWDWRAGTLNQAPMQWFSDTIIPFTVSERLALAAPFIYTTSQPVDRFRLDLQFPNGLFYVNGSGAIGNAGCAINIQYRVSSAGGQTQGQWMQLNGPAVWNVLGTTPIIINPGNSGQNIYNTNTYVSGLRITVEVTGSNTQTTNYNIQANVRTSTAHPPNQGTGFLNWRTGGNVPGVAGGAFASMGTASGTFTNNLVTNPDGSTYFTASSITKVFEIDNLAISTYDFEVIGGTIIQVEGYGRISASGFNNNYKGTWNVSVPSPPLPRLYYDISLQRTDIEYDLATDPRYGVEVENVCWIQDINEILDDVVLYNQTAYAGLEAALGTQITSDPNVTFLVQGKKVNIYDRTGVIETYGFSNNPADIALDILLNPNHRFAISTSRIDYAAFDNWRQFCVANNLAFNGAIDSQLNVWDALMLVMRVGHAGPALIGLRWSVVIEGPSDPVMLFTQDNMIKGTFTSEFTGRKNRSNLVEVQYWDATDDYVQKSCFAYDDSIAAGDALVQSTIQMIGVTDTAQAQNEAWFQLNLNRYVTQSCKFDVFLQAMGCSIGDVIIVQHDMTAWGYAARVISWDGTNLVIDQPIPSNNETNWNIGNIVSVRQFASSSVANASGAQITCGALTNPSGIQMSPQELILGPAGGIANWQNEITSGGCARVIIDNIDYGVNDQQIINNVLVLTLDRTFTGSINDTVYLYKTDQFVEASLVAPAPPAANATSQTLRIASWNGDQGFFVPGDRVILGQTSVYKKPFRVQHITYKTDHIRTLSCIEYNASIYGTNPGPPVTNALANIPFEVSNLRAQQTQTVLPGGALQYQVQFQWDMPLNDPQGYLGADVYIGYNNQTPTLYSSIGTPTSSITVPANNGDTVFCQVVAYDLLGNRADLLYAPSTYYTIGTSNVQPTGINVTSFTAQGGIRQITLNWTLPNDPFIKNVEIWSGTTNVLSNSALVYSGLTNYWTNTNLVPQETLFYWIRTISVAGTYSSFVGPVSATTSLLLTGDLSAGIINTAAFAQGISPVGLVTPGNSLPTNPSQVGGVQVIFNANDGQLYRWDGTEFTAAIPAANISGELTAAQIGTINFSELTGQVTAAQVAAGSILTTNLAVGNPTNYIWNGCLGQVSDGWKSAGYGGAANPNFGPASGNNRLAGFGSGFVNANGSIPNGGGLVAWWQPDNTVAGVPVIPGQAYGASAQVSSPLTSALQMQWFDVNNNFISTSLGTGYLFEGSGGLTLSQYTLATMIAVAPANAATCQLHIVAQNNTGSAFNSQAFMLFTQAMFGPVPPNAVQVAPWQPGGVTTISGGVLTANSITANQMAANSITANALAANSITAGKIAAGAVQAGQIAANAIEATNLAADFALFNYEQVGYLTVNNLNIVGGSVTDTYSANGQQRGNVSPVVTLNITTPANADGSNVTRNGFAFAVATVNTSQQGGFYPAVNLGISQDGNAIAYGYGSPRALDSITCLGSVVLTTGSSTITVTQQGSNANLTTATLFIFVSTV